MTLNAKERQDVNLGTVKNRVMEYPSRKSMATARSIFDEFSRLKHYGTLPVSKYGGCCMHMILNYRKFIFTYLPP